MEHLPKFRFVLVYHDNECGTFLAILSSLLHILRIPLCSPSSLGQSIPSTLTQ